MSTSNQDKQSYQHSDEQPLQPPRRHVTASPEDADEDMEQGTQSGIGSPRNAETAAPDVMKRSHDDDH